VRYPYLFLLLSLFDAIIIGGKECKDKETLESTKVADQTKLMGHIRGTVVLTFITGGELLPDDHHRGPHISSSNVTAITGSLAAPAGPAVSSPATPGSDRPTGDSGMIAEGVTPKQTLTIELLDEKQAGPVAICAHHATRPAIW
jgi:hypothetical protein